MTTLLIEEREVKRKDVYQAKYELGDVKVYLRVIVRSKFNRARRVLGA